MKTVDLCDPPTCFRIAGHSEAHNSQPREAWSFFDSRDTNKINKAGYATPRGGAKGAYQNHVYRNNRVIIPFERLGSVDLSAFADGYIVRLLPDQYFESAGTPRPQFVEPGSTVIVGDNAFVLYRSHDALLKYRPVNGWSVRSLAQGDVVVTRRSAGVTDAGHYVLRLSNAGAERSRDVQGPPQGIFAPEYASADTNYLSQTMLAWLIVHSRKSPYTTAQAMHLKAILDAYELLKSSRLESSGVTRNGLSICPLCLRVIDYAELHEKVDFGGVEGLLNAGLQVEGATRSTKANLFHLEPLVYERLNHRPALVVWGHAHCNTLLGQRHCYSLAELQEIDLKLGVIVADEVMTIGWISDDYQMIRSPHGAVWVQLSTDMPEDERTASLADEETT